MHFDFRPLLRRAFAELSQKYPYLQTPRHQQGAHQRKSKHQGPWCLALAKPHFWNLGCCIWSLFLETSESDVRQYQRQVQGCTYEGKSKCAVPFSLPDPRAAGGGSPEQAVMYTVIMIHNIKLSRNFRE